MSDQTRIQVPVMSKIYAMEAVEVDPTNAKNRLLIGKTQFLLKDALQGGYLSLFLLDAKNRY